MATRWSDLAARYLLATTHCPRCDAELDGATVCPECRAILGGAAGAAVLDASRRAAEAVLERDRLISALPTTGAAPAAAAATTAERAEAPTAAASAAQPAAADAKAAKAVASKRADAAESQVSVQSVLAVAGAGLFAIAAIVFALLNPDVGYGVRTSVIAVVTVVFIAGAWLLRRRGVTFSAEAIGALGLVFLALDVQAVSELVPQLDPWLFAALGTLVSSLVMLVIAWLARIRTWLWASFVGLALVPAFVGYAAGDWGAVWGHVGVVAVALAAHELARRMTTRFSSPLRAEHATLGTLQVIASALAIVVLPFVGTTDDPRDTLLRVAVLLVLALAAALGARNGAPRIWSFACGGLVASAFALLPLVLVGLEPTWLVALVTAAAAVAVATSGVLGNAGRRPLRARPTQTGALTVLLVLVGPALVDALVAACAVPLEALIAATDDSSLDRPSGILGSLTATDEIAAVLALLAAAVGIAALAWATRRSPGGTARRFPVGILCLALWLGVAAAFTLIAWHGFVPLGRSLVGIAIAVVATLLVALPQSRFTSARASVRAPFVLLAHLGLVEAALITWIDPSITVPVGVVIVAAVLVVSRSVPASMRAAYVGVAYAYALVIVATALAQAGLDTIPVLCLTTTVASLAALAATLVRRVDAPSWAAILMVTAVPFLIGIASVLGERSGWTALSTGVTFLLALSLVLTRRPGLDRVVRSAAAALLVPSLAVVVVCLGAELLEVSGSPVTLPIIAAIVAATLPCTRLIGEALARRGLGHGEATAARIAIEASTLVTGAIAVLLALVREAAGIGTAIAVLVILGLGAGATSVFAGRRYGWWLAGASWTGALWCVWAMLGVDVVEPYTLPPAIGAGVIATILTVRGRPGVGLFASALACAVLPSVIALAWIGDDGADVAWRLIGLLAASVALIIAGVVLAPRRGVVSSSALPSTAVPSTAVRSRAQALRTPLLVAAIVAAAAGPIQAVRYGLGVDPAPVADPDLVMLPALGLSVAGAVLASVAAWMLHRGALRVGEPARVERWLGESRWLYAPAALFLVAGPVTAIRRDWFAIWTLWTLMAVLLVTAIVTVAIALRRRPELPPFWFTYGLAWVVGVAGWSQRDLRVEVFSLPLGLAVLVAGVIAMRPPATPVVATLNSWPVGFRGSWRLLAPGIVLTLLPSVLATGTDPQLYRPILVIALALVAILVGSSRKLAAPFILGLAVLPVENVVVFAAQLDRTVGAMPWWITLATAGAVLLTIAVGSERRTTKGLGVAARLRELE